MVYNYPLPPPPTKKKKHVFFLRPLDAPLLRLRIVLAASLGLMLWMLASLLAFNMLTSMGTMRPTYSDSAGNSAVQSYVGVSEVRANLGVPSFGVRVIWESYYLGVDFWGPLFS